MIPKNIHFIWFGDTLPENSDNKMNKWRSMGWDIFLWHNNTLSYNDESKVEINTEITSYLDTFSMPVQKSDVLRLYAVHQFGGVYMDWDFDFVKPIDELLNCHAFVCREDSKNICNGIFGAVKNSDFMIEQINALDNVPKDERTWGVKLMTDIVMDKPDIPVVIYPQEYFFPYSWDEVNEQNKQPKVNTFLIHRWAKSWWKKP